MKVKKVISILSAGVITAMILTSFGEPSYKSGESFIEVTIGSQVWMGENLNVDKFRNGDPIQHAKTSDDWSKAAYNKQPAWCYYRNEPINGDRYGKLYNWYAVNDPRGLAPDGWKIPSDKDWSILTDFLGGQSVAGKKMKFTDFWSGEGGNGTNESGFAGLPGGYRLTGMQSGFYGIGQSGHWWSSSEKDTHLAWSRDLLYKNTTAYGESNGKSKGFSVRCRRD